MVTPRFRKSSHSTGDGECVEVALNVPGAVAVRDSTRPTGPHIRCTPTAWAAFAGALAAGHGAGAAVR